MDREHLLQSFVIHNGVEIALQAKEHVEKRTDHNFILGKGLVRWTRHSIREARLQRSRPQKTAFPFMEYKICMHVYIYSYPKQQSTYMNVKSTQGPEVLSLPAADEKTPFSWYLVSWHPPCVDAMLIQKSCFKREMQNVCHAIYKGFRVHAFWTWKKIVLHENPKMQISKMRHAGRPIGGWHLKQRWRPGLPYGEVAISNS